MIHGHHHDDFSPARPDGVDPVSWGVHVALRRVTRLSHRLFHLVLAEKGGHPGQAICLWVLGQNEGISQRDLAERMHLAPPTVTTMLQKMERGGLLERSADENDQRVTRIHLTEQGRALGAELRSAHADYVETAFGGMSEKDRRELERLLDVLAEGLSSALARFDDRAPHRHDLPIRRGWPGRRGGGLRHHDEGTHS
jgi:MarR family transcriptional regulator, organic hydroperoxide resistance regulator